MLCYLPFRWKYYGTKRVCRWCGGVEFKRYDYESGCTFWRAA